MKICPQCNGKIDHLRVFVSALAHYTYKPELNGALEAYGPYVYDEGSEGDVIWSECPKCDYNMTVDQYMALPDAPAEDEED